VKKTAIACAAVVALTLSACGGESYNRDEAIDDLVETGLSEEAATCIVDGVEDEFGIDKLNSTDDLSNEDEEALMTITTDCAF